MNIIQSAPPLLPPLSSAHIPGPRIKIPFPGGERQKKAPQKESFCGAL